MVHVAGILDPAVALKYHYPDQNPIIGLEGKNITFRCLFSGK